MTDELTIDFTVDPDDGWVTAQIREHPGAISQGRDMNIAYENVLHALADLEDIGRARMFYATIPGCDCVRCVEDRDE